jgi:hypothetical protein
MRASSRRSKPGDYLRLAAEMVGNVAAFVREMIPAASLIFLLVLAWALGGATRSNAGQFAVLEIVSLACVALILLTQPSTRLPAQARWPGLVLLGLPALALLQLVPLPWGIWAALPGRETIATGLERLGLDGGFRPLSLSPESSISGILKFMPPLAVFWIALQLPWRRLMTTLLWVAVVIALLSTLWGIAQVFGIAPNLYPWTYPGFATGPFANPNHQASFVLMCLPLIAVLVGQARQNADMGAGGERALLWVSAAVFAFLGVLAAGSLFGYLMAPFVIAVCGLVGAGRFRRGKWGGLAIGMALSVLALGLVVWNSGLDQLGDAGDAESPRSRSAIAAGTLDGALAFAPVGTGLGTFEKVYPLFERDGEVPGTYVNHAHNEYLQIALEFGAPGVLLMAVFLVWFMTRLRVIWLTRQDFGSLLRIKMGASVALCVPLLHSILDYPMRTPAVACLAAACLAVLLSRRETQGAQEMPATEGAGASGTGRVNQSTDQDETARASS